MGCYEHLELLGLCSRALFVDILEENESDNWLELMIFISITGLENIQFFVRGSWSVLSFITNSTMHCARPCIVISNTAEPHPFVGPFHCSEAANWSWNTDRFQLARVVEQGRKGAGQELSCLCRKYALEGDSDLRSKRVSL